MFPVCNRPLLERLLEQVVATGINQIGIVVGWQAGSIRSHFSNGNQFACSITYIEQPSPEGTAAAAVCASEWIGQEDVLVIHGDLLIPDDALPAVVSSFREQNGGGVAATHEVDNISEVTSVSFNSNGALTDYAWKPRGGKGTALTGIYCFSSSLLQDLANVSDVQKAQFGIAPPLGKEIAAVIPICYRDGRSLTRVPVDGPAFDMDYPWQPDTFSNRLVEVLGAKLSKSRISDSATVDPSAHIDGPIVVGEHSVIGRNAHIRGPAWIGDRTNVTEGSHIGRHSMIGDDCVIGPYAKVNGFLGNDCRITYLGEFRGTMLDGGRVTHQIQLSGVFGLGAEIGAGTQCGTLRFDDGPIEVEVLGQRKVANGFSGVLFGDYARTGVGALMMPGRIVGPCSMVGAGIVLMKNLPAHKALILKQETELVDWSAEIYNR